MIGQAASRTQFQDFCVLLLYGGPAGVPQRGRGIKVGDI